MNNVLLTGASGQLGLTIQQMWETASCSAHLSLIPLNHNELDITNSDAVSDSMSRYKPKLVINASAYTAVDKAELDSENAYKVNEIGPRNLAVACEKLSSRLIHVSTDFVYDGTQSGNSLHPYLPADEPRPTGVYGQSKLAGEKAIQDESDDAVIIRTSWLYSEHRSNFVKTMLRLMSERETLGVVGDQIGSPTSTRSLTKLILAIIELSDTRGIYHWSDLGSISWYDFAKGIQEEGILAGLLKREISINAISTSQYPTPAKRPSYSVLDCSSTIRDCNVTQNDWKTELRIIVQCLAELGE